MKRTDVATMAGGAATGGFGAVGAEHRISGPEVLPAGRTHELKRGAELVGRLTYHLTPGPLATMQILDMAVIENQRRRKVGTRLFELAMADARSLLVGQKLRRVYVGVGHKSHILMRAFLTHHGFHHVSTTGGLYKGEDLLIYIKSYT